MKLHTQSKTHLTHMSSQTTDPKHNSQNQRKTSPPWKEKTKFVQAVAGTLLYYGCAVDCMILMALSSLATKQAKPMAKTMAKVMQLFDYLATQEDAIMTYNASDMMLQVHSNAGYANKKMA
jgi:hypothetical protein